ncbi:hypothetical protein D3C77_337780 [compost metagenome]
MGTDLLLIAAQLPSIQAGQFVLVPLQSLTWTKVLKRYIANPANGWRRLTGARFEHLLQPFALALVSEGHTRLVAQATGVDALKTEHVGQAGQVPATQQADVQRHIQARNESCALLRQLGKVFLYRAPAHEHMADATKQVGHLAGDRIEQIAAVEDRAAGGDQTVVRARWQDCLVRRA